MWNDTEVPLAYLISFRAANTWLHGDERGSIDRFHNSYGSPYIPPNKKWLRYNQKQLRAKPLILKGKQRGLIKSAIRETCRIRGWTLLVVNARTNHVHAVACADRDPDTVLLPSRRTHRESCESKDCGVNHSAPGHVRGVGEIYGTNAALRLQSIMS